MPSIKAALSATAIALMASAANAHMVMVTPPPYGSPDNSPIDAAGANFPCKATSNSGGTVTNMAIGSQQQLVFKGEAVHGGGSCQVSLTTDNPATKNSKWMVIHSIIGGCPARDAAGNLGGDNDANEIDPDKYNYSIPEGITPGTYTLAWTWFNKIGNREMYMNCANVKITGGSGSTTPGKRDVYANETDEFVHPELLVRAASFPPMFVANIPTTDCETVDSENVLFPDPGASVESAAANPQASSNLPVAPTGPKCGASGAAAPAATGSASAGSGAASPVASPAASAASPDSQSAAGAAPAAATPAPATGASAAAPDSQSAAAPAVPASPAASAAAPTSAAAPAPAATGVSNSSGSSASTGTCTQPGQSICSPDGLQIGTCTQGNTVTWIPVAAGTKCVGGFMVAAKRSPKFAENYVRRVL